MIKSLKALLLFNINTIRTMSKTGMRFTEWTCSNKDNYQDRIIKLK